MVQSAEYKYPEREQNLEGRGGGDQNFKYEVNGPDSLGENFWKPRDCTDGRMEGGRHKDGRI